MDFVLKKIQLINLKRLLQGCQQFYSRESEFVIILYSIPFIKKHDAKPMHIVIVKTILIKAMMNTHTTISKDQLRTELGGDCS